MTFPFHHQCWTLSKYDRIKEICRQHGNIYKERYDFDEAETLTSMGRYHSDKLTCLDNFSVIKFEVLSFSRSLIEGFMMKDMTEVFLHTFRIPARKTVPLLYIWRFCCHDPCHHDLLHQPRTCRDLDWCADHQRQQRHRSNANYANAFSQVVLSIDQGFCMKGASFCNMPRSPRSFSGVVM